MGEDRSCDRDSTDRDSDRDTCYCVTVTVAQGQSCEKYSKDRDSERSNCYCVTVTVAQGQSVPMLLKARRCDRLMYVTHIVVWTVLVRSTAKAVTVTKIIVTVSLSLLLKASQFQCYRRLAAATD
ncbi:hypothetical protein J6590_036568 [Homalodisca vitripennis]|nr:hypothetical protein J6590_036568 [Homalodisca vitripennis]